MIDFDLLAEQLSVRMWLMAGEALSSKLAGKRAALSGTPHRQDTAGGARREVWTFDTTPEPVPLEGPTISTR